MLMTGPEALQTVKATTEKNSIISITQERQYGNQFTAASPQVHILDPRTISSAAELQGKDAR